MKTLKLVKSDTYLRPYAEAIEGRYNYALKREQELTGGKTLSEWANGYMYFGLHKVKGERLEAKGKGQWVLREWAPNATAIYMIGDFNNWQKDEAYRLQPVGNGVWEVVLDEDMIKHEHLYKQGASFKKVMMLYRFDKKLRMFLFNEIEKIEVAFRSAIANIVAEETGNIFWMTDASMFANGAKFLRTITLIEKELKSSKEEFIKHLKEKYSNDYPPAWMLVEILPLGTVTRIYENIANNALRKKIAARFGLPVPVFSSWMTVVTLTRNSCCHHARVWNKENAIMPMQIKKSDRAWISSSASPKRIFYNICILKWFLDIIVPNNEMKTQLKQ